jgi:protein O-mannosyl-transferase
MPEPSAAPVVPRLRQYLGCGAVLALLVAVYWPALQGGLVWDDAAHVTRPELRTGAGLIRIWTDLHATQQYYPVLHTAFWLEHRLWGDHPLGYHLLNVLLHGGAACLFASILRRLLGRQAPPGTCELAALLFALHPVAVESVAWISEQKNTLSLVCYLLAARAYLGFAETRRPGSYALALGWFLLALGTKSVTATLPAALLVVLGWRQGQLHLRRDVAPLLPWLAIGAGAGWFTSWIERTQIGAHGAAFDLTLAQRVLLAGRVIWFYLGKLAWPADLCFIYPHWPAPSLSWVGGILATAALTLALWLLRKRQPGPLAAWLFFVGTLTPVLGFLKIYPFLFSYVADHFQYVAMLGVLAAAAIGVTTLLARASTTVRAAGWTGLGVVLAALAIRSHTQSGDYRDSETLYRATLSRNPSCWMAQNNLAAALAEATAGIPEALRLYASALALRPDYAEAHNNLGNLLAHLPGRGTEALAHFEEALRLQPDFAEAHVNLANALIRIPGRTADALAHYERAIQLQPGNAAARLCLANALAGIPGRAAEARAEYEIALELQPEFPEARDSFAGFLLRTPGEESEALAQYQVALRENPRLARTHYNLAVALERIPGRAEEARAHYEEALRLKPDYAEAHNNLGIADAKAGRLESAREHWERALRLRPGYEDALRNLERLRELESAEGASAR